MKFLNSQRFVNIFFLSVIFLFTSNKPEAQCTHPDDKAALVAIYNALDGPNWPVNSDPNNSGFWDVGCTSCDVCDWFGIYDFNGGDGRVDLLNLTSFDGFFLLNGTIPQEISLLSELESLWIGGLNGNIANVTGSIPTSMSNTIIHFQYQLPNKKKPHPNKWMWLCFIS